MQLLLVQILHNFAYVLRVLARCDQQSIRSFDHHQIADPDHRDKLARRMNIISPRVQQECPRTGYQIAFWRTALRRVMLVQSCPRAQVVPSEIGGQAEDIAPALRPLPNAAPAPRSPR